VSNAGTSWTFQIRDKAATPSILLSGTLALPGDGLPVKVHFDESLYMDAGIDIVTAGTPGVVDVWLTYGLQA
jgi:hypothetical protein